ncbi:MAG: lipopolysaccharide heptosyltransferase II [Armatimonadota bacterium]|nr:lipopolysaccharide heptosyltransferase II [bacterium]MCS7309536.1 lipopolysaccharide heptosyltransferase II [Armatimonadota bacterium]MDW8289466.1 lipopolysaccharide heptosyltransferase II [Armatimonadota bacterium]
MSDPKRILIVTKSRYLGDTIVAVPAMRALAKRYPQAHVTLLSNPAAGELLRGCPYVHEYLARSVAVRRRVDLEMWRVLRRKRYDLAVLFNRSFSSAVLAFMARIPERVGFDTEHRGFLLTKRVPYEPPKHEILHLLDVAEACGAPAQGTHLELWVTPEERQAIRKRLAEEGIDLNRPILLVQPGANDPYVKRWRTEGFIWVAQQLQRDNGFQIVLLGASSEMDVAEQVASALKDGALNLVGRTSLREALALLAEVDLLLGNDTGMMHAAVALGTPTVAVFAPHKLTRWAHNHDFHRALTVPLPDGARPTLDVIHQHLYAVKEEDVLQAAREVLQVKPPRSHAMVG